MRVAQFSEFGGPQALRLEEAAEPAPGPSDVLIKVTAVGLNFLDTPICATNTRSPLRCRSRRERRWPARCTGLGANVDEFKIGQRVVAFIGGNGCREMVVTKAQNAVPIPSNVSDEAAAGFPSPMEPPSTAARPAVSSRKARRSRCSAPPEARASPPSKSPS